MKPVEKIIITVSVTVNAPIEKVWNCWTTPQHITQWNNASPDWHTPRVEIDLRTAGKFLYRIEAKDGSMGFDFLGIYDAVKTNELIAYTMGDERKATVIFEADGNSTKIIESFEAETENSVELQKGGWQGILDNFKNYVETKV